MHLLHASERFQFKPEALVIHAKGGLDPQTMHLQGFITKKLPPSHVSGLVILLKASKQLCTVGDMAQRELW